MKYLLWAVLIYLGWRWFQASQQSDRPAAPDAPEPEAGGEGAVEKMVRCDQCGIHLPASEAVDAPGALHFCSPAHREQHQSRHPDFR